MVGCWKRVRIDWVKMNWWNHQKQLFAVVPQNMCSWKFHKFNRKTPVLESHFNNVTGLKAWRPATLLKRDFNTDFLWNLQIFSEHLFWITSAKDFFYVLLLFISQFSPEKFRFNVYLIIHPWEYFNINRISSTN